MRFFNIFVATTIAALFATPAAAQDFAAEYNRQWGLRMIGLDPELAARWNGAGVLVGVSDTGLETGMMMHPEFAGRLNGLSYDGYTDGPLDEDTDAHGTHVAGIIAANRDGLGMSGVAWGSTIVPLRILGGPDNGVADTVSNPLRYGLRNGVRIFNASWGTPSWYNTYVTTNPFTGEIILETPVTKAEILSTYAPFIQTFREVVAADGILVFANGNLSNTLPLGIEAAAPFYVPELERGWLAVTAVGPTGQIAAYAQTCSVGMNWCLAAPGGDQSLPNPPAGTGDGGIIAPYPAALFPQPDGLSGLLDGRYYASFNGTSMAAPHVSGALALAKQLYPNASHHELRNLILQTSTDIGAEGIDPIYGWGLLNVRNVLNSASPEAGTVYAQQSWARAGVVNHLIDGLNPHASAERNGTWGFWGMPLGIAGSINNADPARSADLGAGGLTVGVEGSVAPDWYLKVFGATSQSSIRSGNGNSASDTGFHLGAQVVYESPAWFGDLTVGSSLFAGSVARSTAPGAGGVIGGGVGTSSTLDWAQWSAIRLGHHIEAGEAGIVSPYVFGRLVNQNLSAFSETGSILAISGTAASELVGEVGVGLKWEGPSFTTGQLDITPVLDVSYSHQSGNDGRPFELLGNGFSATSGAASGGTLQVSTAAEISSDESPFDLKLGYTAQIQSNTVVHTVGLKLMGAF